jgi:hypothetical protein
MGKVVVVEGISKEEDKTSHTEIVESKPKKKSLFQLQKMKVGCCKKKDVGHGTHSIR